MTRFTGIRRVWRTGVRAAESDLLPVSEEWYREEGGIGCGPGIDRDGHIQVSCGRSTMAVTVV